MMRLSVSRRVLVLGIAAAAGTGIGVGSASAWSAWGADSPPAPRVVAAASSAPAPTTPASTPSAPASPLTPDQAGAIAVHASPGTVTEVEPDVEATGPVFDVEIQHTDGTETKVEVDATTGHVISTETDGADNPNDPADQPGDGH
jgi:hypothetical protein